jgi:diguanylate cyclase
MSMLPSLPSAAPAQPPDPLETVAPRRVPLWAVAGAAGVAAVCTAASLAWAFDVLLGGAGWPTAPLAAAAAVALVLLPVALVVARLLRELSAQREKIARLDTIDLVTGASNRAPFIALAEREWARARRYGGEPALLLIDVDRFQRLLDTRGAGAGDEVLKAVVRDVAPTLRGADVLARFGGSQLAVWLAQVDPIGALDVADRIRERTEALAVEWEGQMLRVTASVGVAALRPTHLNLATLIGDAEAAVQAARQAGGNCVRAAPVDPAKLRRIGPSVGDNQAAGPL